MSEFEKWFESKNLIPGTVISKGFVKEIAKDAWDARGKMDAKICRDMEYEAPLSSDASSEAFAKAIESA